MEIGLDILVTGRNKGAVDGLYELLQPCAGYRVARRVISNGHMDPLHGVEPLPALLILDLSAHYGDELEALAALSAAHRPALIVTGSTQDPAVLRLAMRAGAREFLPAPPEQEALLAAVRRIAADRVSQSAPKRAGLTCFVNAKGGSGSTLLACNTAHIMAAVTGLKVALVDMDIQYGALPHYFDMKGRHGLLEALETVEHLDAVAIEGFMSKHSSGLHVLSASTDRLVMPSEISVTSLDALIVLLRQHYQQVLVDMPRQIDELSSTLIECSDRIVVVLQQTLSHVRDATRLIGILRRELAVTDERINIVVNRYEKKAPIELADIARALNHDALIAVPNDYRIATESTNVGAPLYGHARGTTLTRALMELETSLGGSSADAQRQGLFRRAARLFTGARS